MSVSVEEPSQSEIDPFRTPEMEQAKAGRDIAPAEVLALEEINPLNAHLFRENR